MHLSKKDLFNPGADQSMDQSRDSMQRE